MKKLSSVLFGSMIVSAGLTGLASGQNFDRTKLYTAPQPPPREVLDRLNLKMNWRLYVPMDGRRDGLATVQIHGSDLYVQTRSGLVMLVDADTGVIRWRARVGLPYRVAQELAFNSREVYVVNNTYLYALERQTGALRWQYRLRDGVSSAPIADENLIFIATPPGNLDAYYLPRPDVRAALPGGSPAAGDPKAVKDGYDVVVEKKETVEERKQRMVAIMGESRSSTSSVSYLTPSVRDASTEEETGPHPIQVWKHISSLRLEYPILYSGSYLMVPTPSGVVMTMSKLPKDNGSASEIYRFSSEASISVPAGHYEEFAYFGADDANLYAMQISNGKLRWRYTTGAPITRKPVVTEDDLFIVAGRKGMTRVDRTTGEAMWRIPVHGRIVEDNAAADRFLAVNPKYVYATDVSGRLLVLDRRRGVQLSQYDVKDFVFPIENTITDRLYLAANNGLIVCLHDREYEKPIRLRKGEEDAENPIRIKLAETFPDAVVPKMPLRDLLENWTKRFPPLKFRIAERAFKAANVESPAAQGVAVPQADRKTFAIVLKNVLDQAKCVYQVVDDTVVILPAAAPAAP